MAFVDVINDYTQNATGTLTDADGQTVNYTVTDGATTINRANHGNDSARIPGMGQDTVVVSFDEPVVGVSITFQGSDNNEFYNVLVDGVIVNLADLVASGDATLANVGTVSTHTLNPDGTISGGVNNAGSIGQIIYNIPVTSVGAVGAGSPNNGNFDGVEVGIDDGVFNVVCLTGDTLIATPAESLYLGSEGLRAMPTASRAEILAIFPALAQLDILPQTACLVPSGKLQKRLVARHAKNQKPLLELFVA